MAALISLARHSNLLSHPPTSDSETIAPPQIASEFAPCELARCEHLGTLLLSSWAAERINELMSTLHAWLPRIKVCVCLHLRRTICFKRTLHSRMPCLHIHMDEHDIARALVHRCAYVSLYRRAHSLPMP